MELRQLAYLLAVAEEESFTRAAGRLHVAQPGVSVQIQHLERELGSQLLDRTGPRVRLTEAGRTVLPFARAAVNATEGARRAVQELTGLQRGRIAVGAVTIHAGADAGVIDRLADFHQRHPRVNLTLTSGAADDLVEKVCTGTLDLAFVAFTGDGPEELEHHVMAKCQLVVAVAPEDSWANRKSVGLDELANRAVVSTPPGSGSRDALRRACAAVGCEVAVSIEAGDPHAAATLAARGMGVAVLLAPTAAEHAERLRALNIDPAPPPVHIALVWPPHRTISAAAAALVAEVRAHPTIDDE